MCCDIIKTMKRRLEREEPGSSLVSASPCRQRDGKGDLKRPKVILLGVF